MLQLNYLAIIVAAAAAFVVSLVWYGVFGETVSAARGVQGAAAAAAAADMARPPIWKMLVELVRCIVIAAVLAGLAAKLGALSWGGAALLGFVLWIGFPVVLWLGAVIWENVPLTLAAVHAGDWLVKLVVVAVIVGVWR
ncbi:MAG: DUF1761 domain-containing protein [Gemmatimonadaceae bacterium]